ncbi:MAG: type II toxin-antitoxin system Phd/YefM family antitoxin [Acidobacteriia bacterium]|nr:type II toxin-antitoxin system Phd/YefM family antitoxin [Terriglobia bacterium]
MREVQLCEAKAKLSALVEEAAQGETAVITRHGKPRAIILGVDEWNRLRRVPSFGRLLLSSPLEDGDLPPRSSSARQGTPHFYSPCTL